MRSSAPLASEASGAAVGAPAPLEQLASMNAAVRVAAAALKGRESKSAKITPFVGKKKLKLGLPSLTKAFYGIPQLVSNLLLRAWNGSNTHRVVGYERWDDC